MTPTKEPKFAASAPAPAALPFTMRLRAATKSEHDMIEGNRRMRRLTDAALDVEEYVAILVRLARYFAALEAEVRRWGGRFPRALDLDARLVKRELLGRDIQALAPALAASGLPPAVGAVDSMSSIESAWGCLYVAEGATLGGQIMARSLHAQFGFTAEHGTAFYNAYGRQNGSRWQAFKAALNAAVADDGLDETEIVAAAQATFRSMNRWMDADT